MKRTLLLLLVAACYSTVFSQGEIPVNMYTGTPGISINLYTLTDHDLSESVSLAYNVNAISRNAPVSPFGMGWSLMSGGQISRQVRGLPDDFAGTGSDTRKGWLYNNNFSSILNFGNTADLSPSTCTDEQADQQAINAYGYKIDTEPDFFSYSVGGLSGHFVFGNSGAIQLIPYQDVSIVPTFAGSPTNMTITGWTITTNTGVVYTLNETSNTTRTITKYNNYTTQGIDQTLLTLFDRDYNLYSTAVSYSSSWMVSRMQSPTGSSITYTYTTATSTANNPRNAQIFDAQFNLAPGVMAGIAHYSLMNESVTSMRKSLLTMTASSGASVNFSYSSQSAAMMCNDPARTPTLFRNFTFDVTNGFLNSITEADGNFCSQKPPYSFTYKAMPPASTGQDFWGFPNGALNFSQTKTGNIPTNFPKIYVYPNAPASERYRLYQNPLASGPEIILNGDADRTPNPGGGALSKIIYPAGGETDFSFEANTYYDSAARKNQLAGGLRLKSVTYFDGINPLTTITKTLSYVDSKGKSTGKLIQRPAFALPVWQYKIPTSTDGYYTYSISNILSPKDYSSLTTAGTSTLWHDLTIVTDFDVSSPDYTNGGSSVGYTHVKVTRPNSGSAVFDYIVPAAYGDPSTGVNPTDWSPTTAKIVRPSNCPVLNAVPGNKGETYGYPTFPNAYYDYERGLLQTKTEFNAAGTLVRKTQTNYQYIFKSGSQPGKVVGLAYDRFANANDMIFFSGSYTQLTDVAKVAATETVTTYDDKNASRFSTETVQYTYGSAYHKLVSKISKTTTDGTVYGTSFKYTLDYPVTSTVPSDTTLWMIQLLKNAGRTNTVIEQVNTVQRPNGTEKTTSATLIKFRPFSANKPLLRYQMAFRPSSPVTDFTNSSVSGTYAFANDTRYETVNKINAYDNFDIPISSTGEDSNTSGMLWGYGQRLPVVKFNQASSVSIGFSDFETTTLSSFTLANDYYGSGRTGVNGIYPSATLSRTVVKPASATNYLLSFWIKNQSGTNVTLQVIIKDANGTTLSTTNYTYNLTSNDYQYFTQLINVSSLPSTFSIQVQGQSLASPTGTVGSYNAALLPMLDDIGFYPDYATLSTITYDVPLGPNSQTDPSGFTVYSSYDGLGRLQYIRDQDHNIRQRTSYAATGQVLPTLVASVVDAFGAGYYINSPIQFNAAPNFCIKGALYEWDFGDGAGFTAPSTSNVSPQYTFTKTKLYDLTLRVSHPDYDPVTYTWEVTITLPPLGVLICATGVKVMSGTSVTDSYSCFTNPNTADWVTFKISALDQTYGATFTYQWKQRQTVAPGDTPLPWNLVGPNANTYGPQKVSPGQASFEVMCTVTANDGRSTDSNSLPVTVTN